MQSPWGLITVTASVFLEIYSFRGASEPPRAQSLFSYRLPKVWQRWQLDSPLVARYAGSSSASHQEQLGGCAVIAPVASTL